jgi:putative protease
MLDELNLMKNLSPPPAELLMPAGSLDKLRFAFAYGADAVYAGVPVFSLRARENDFDKATLAEAIAYSHRLGKRIYMTMNIYAHNMKVERFLQAFCELSDLGPDGFIMTDVGLIHKALELRPEAVIHLSTQANATNWASVEFWRDLGIKRIIMPRELSIHEMATIHDKVPGIELETFVHGAICIAYSGRCLISNYLNHRDANQGTCTNSCRWEYALSVDRQSLLQTEESHPACDNYQALSASYKAVEAGRAEKEYLAAQFEIDEDQSGTYLMNSKDLCAVELLAELHAAGMISFKVEGRSKSVYYLAVVTRAYRSAIDDVLAGRPFDRNNLTELVSTANRTLMTGFLKKRPDAYGENFEDGASLPLTHRFAGRVREYQPQTGEALVDIKNRISIGDRLEWLTPSQTVSLPVSYISKTDGTRVSVAHAGLPYHLPVPFEPDEFTLIRQVMKRDAQA